MHIFEFKLPLEAVFFDFLKDLTHTAFDVVQIVFGNNAAFGKHLGMGHGACDIGFGHTLVKVHAGGVTKDKFGHRLRKASAPSFFFGGKRIGMN